MKLRRFKLLSVLLCVCLVIPVFSVGTFPIANAAGYTEKEITATNTYESMTPIASATLEEENGVYSIANADDWDALVAKNSDFAGKTIVLTADLDLTGKTSLPALAGKLDGNGKKVTGLSTALIASLSDGAEVMNLIVEGAKVTSVADENTAIIAGEAAAATSIKVTNVAVKNADISGLGTTFAGIVGAHTGAGKLTLTNCTVSGTVKGSATDTEMWIGGMVGKVATASASAEFYNCKNSAVLSITTAKNSYLGGMLGAGYTIKADGCVNDGDMSNVEGSYHARIAGMLGYLQANGSATLTDCVNNGDLTSNMSAGYNCFVGGMLGQLAGNGTISLSGCKNTGDITAAAKATNGKCAGMISYNCAGDTTITDCVNEGDIYGYYAASGIVADNRRNLTIINCVNEGNVSGVGKSDQGGVGGIVGYISDKTKTLNVTDCRNSGDVTGEYCTGGILGWTKDMTANVTTSFNSGEITSTMHGAGGIIGFVRYIANIDGCVNTGNIYCNTNKETGAVAASNTSGVGNMSAGGILGWAYLDNTTPTTVKNSINLGNVSAPTGAGGISGLINSSKATSTVDYCASFGNITVGNNCAVIVGRVANSVAISNCTGDGVLDYQYTSGTNKGVLVGCKGKETYTSCTATATIDGVKTLSVDGAESAAADNAALIEALKIASVDTQMSADKTTALFIAGVNDLEGLSATGFEVLKVDGEGRISNILTKTSEKIYTSLNGYDENGTSASVAASEYEVAYMTAMEIYNIPTDETVTYVYRPFAVAEDGETVIYGTTSYLTFEAVTQ